MKKLICAKDIENAQKEGRKVIYIDSNTIITPSAKDAARNSGIQFSTEEPVSVCKENVCCDVKPSDSKAFDGEIDSEMIYKVLRAIMDKGLLSGVMDILSNKPYVSEVDSTGLKVVRGNSVRYDSLDTGNSDNKVFYQEIINTKDGSSMNAGFITIEECCFDWETACQEIYYVVEGTLTVKAGEKVYTANAGDSVFFPKGTKLTFGSPDKMKAFYVTY